MQPLCMSCFVIFPRFWNGTASRTNEMMHVDGFIEQKTGNVSCLKACYISKCFFSHHYWQITSITSVFGQNVSVKPRCLRQFCSVWKFIEGVSWVLLSRHIYGAINQHIKEYWLHGLQQKWSNYTLFFTYWLLTPAFRPWTQGEDRMSPQLYSKWSGNMQRCYSSVTECTFKEPCMCWFTSTESYFLSLGTITLAK